MYHTSLYSDTERDRDRRQRWFFLDHTPELDEAIDVLNQLPWWFDGDCICEAIPLLIFKSDWNDEEREWAEEYICSGIRK